MVYEQLVTDILDAVGGKDNITRATHCATRLRLVLKNEKVVDKIKIDGLDKVAGSVFSGGQYQVIIGTNVVDVHKEFITAMGAPEIHEEVVEEKDTNLFNRFFKALVGVMTPMFGVMGAAGIMKGLLALALAFGWLKETDGAYQIWYAVAQAYFYFLPIWIGYNASKNFGGSPFLGAMLGAGMVYPSIVQAYTDGIAMTFFGIPVVMMNYTQSLFPALLAAFVAAKLEIFFRKSLPEVLKMMFAPFFTILILAPLTFLAIGPVMTWVSNTLAAIVMAIYDFSPLLFGIIGGAFWQVVVVFGLHYAFIPVLINNITNLGQDPINAVFQVTVFALAGAAIGYALKTRDSKQRSLGLSVGLTGLLGITEPIIYSVALPIRRQFVYAWISGGIAGAIMAFNSALIYNFGNGGIMAIPLFIAPDGNLSSMYAFIVAAAVAFFGPIVLNFVFGTGENKK
ncbi:PTS transporter subunit EIIC [Streptococcus sp. S784/96/1]|uniref:PTS transporter subunit EIIC n=1 Tax=Streptococcus sp. S784/96/1 TaxID=2653499 RepID=UPI0013896C9E|nr:PTS transporter subunit EIIC [Streptococcus sp. S784/96/1]